MCVSMEDQEPVTFCSSDAAGDLPAPALFAGYEYSPKLFGDHFSFVRRTTVRDDQFFYQARLNTFQQRICRFGQVSCGV